MKSFRLALALPGLALLAVGLGGCLKAPEYSTTPSISNNSVRVSRFNPVNSREQRVDSVYITINYQDGDGDLGLTGEESKQPPYTFPSVFNNNYFVEPLVKHSGSTGYVTPINPATGQPFLPGAYNGRFDHITGLTDSKDAPIKGTLTRVIAFKFPGDVFKAGDVVRFDVSIADRALNVSNIIRTDSIVIKPL